VLGALDVGDALEAFFDRLLRITDAQRLKHVWRTVLAIEEWLVGKETKDAVVERTATIETPSGGNKKITKKPRRKKKRSQEAAPAAKPVAAKAAPAKAA